MQREELIIPGVHWYKVDIGNKNDLISIRAERVENGDTLLFIVEDRIVAEFKEWRYWTYEGKVSKSIFD